MSEKADPVCPECGTARAADGTPACDCARRASDAHRAVRTAEAAAAEDFDPVRIRPFVEVGDDADASSAPPDELVGAVQELPSPHPVPDAPAPADTDEPAPDHRPADPARQRRRRTLTVGLGAAGVVVLTGCLVGGLFRYDSPEHDDSLSGGVRAGLPEGQPSGTGSSSSATSPAAVPHASLPLGHRLGGSLRHRGRGHADRFRRPERHGVRRRPPPPRAVAPRRVPPSGSPPVLRPGDKGPEVIELQLRLQQVGFYSGEADGTYDSQVESAVRGYQITRVVLDDESGVYGRATRAALESETSEP